MCFAYTESLYCLFNCHRSFSFDEVFPNFFVFGGDINWHLFSSNTSCFAPQPTGQRTPSQVLRLAGWSLVPSLCLLANLFDIDARTTPAASRKAPPVLQAPRYILLVFRSSHSRLAVIGLRSITKRSHESAVLSNLF